MLVNNQGGISRNITGDLLFSLFIDEAAKSADVDVVSAGHRTFYYAEESFNRRGYICFVYSGFFRDFVNDVCFGHSVIFLVEKFFGIANLYRAVRIKNEY
jgi:hypothetical protein